jgi:anti-sigma regulatory factor (Ser/Thr protein kinase)
LRFFTEGSRIIFEDGILEDFLRISAAVHNIVHKIGIKEVTLDFWKASFLDAKIMIPIVTIARAYRSEGVHFDIIVPTDRKLAELLHNSNWTHLITPEKFDPRDSKNKNNLSAIQYRNGDEQYKVVDRCLDTILKSVSGLNRKALRALEWSLSEITDNVLNHSESVIGGVLQVMTFPKKKNIEIYVCDAGIGIPASLRRGKPELTDHVQALRAAIDEGVTRNKMTNQGNGLYGAFRCSSLSGGEFSIISGNAILQFAKESLRVNKTNIPARGTFIRSKINYEQEDILEKAFTFKGMRYDFPNDYIDKTYQTSSDEINFVMKDQIEFFGSREAGKAAIIMVENITERLKNKIIFNFEGIHVVSSSFADEVFGKLYVKYGASELTRSCKFSNIDETVKKLINRAIAQRAAYDKGSMVF